MGVDDGVTVGVLVAVALGVSVAELEAGMLTVGVWDRVAPVLPRAVGESVADTVAEGVVVTVPVPVDVDKGVPVMDGEEVGVLLFAYCAPASS